MGMAIHEGVSLLEVTEKIILDEIMLDPQASQLVLVRLSETAVAVDPGKYQALLARLKKIGIVPKTHD